MIPRLEKGTMRLMVVTAAEFAEDGELVKGYDCLLNGLYGAKGAAEAGRPWAAELVLEYLQAIDAFIARYGVRDA